MHKAYVKAKMLVLTLVSLLLALYRAWAVSLLWGWFVTSTFGLPPLSLAVAYGLLLLLTVLVPLQNTGSKEQEINKEYVIRFTLMSLTKTTIPLVFGWIVHLLFT